MNEDQKVQDAPLQSDQIETNQEIKEDPSDKMTPDHPRFKEVYTQLKDLKSKEEEWTKERADLLSRLEKIERGSKSSDEEEFTPDDWAYLERIERGLAKRGNVATKQDILVEKKALEYDRLSGKFDGSNDLPKFVPVEVEAYAKANGFSNLEKAYRDMHYDAFVQHEAKKLSGNPTPPSSEKPTGQGGKDFAENSIEAIMQKAQTGQLTDAEYEKHREAIHQHMFSKAKGA